MLRIEYNRYGGPEELSVSEFTPAAPSYSQIQVRVKAASANPVDWKIRKGTTQILTGWNFPRGMGMDFAGVVEAVGQGAKQFKIGDEVFGAMEMRESSTFAEIINTGEKSTAIKPAALSFEDAAAMPVVGATAWIGLMDKAKLKAGQSVFVAGCLGGVGRAVVQIAQKFGAEVSGNCNANALEEARALGIANVSDYSNFDPRQYRGRFDVVFDTPGKLSLQQSSSMLKPSGVVIHATPNPFTMPGILFSSKHQLVFGQPTTEILNSLANLAIEGKLIPSIGQIVPLSKAIPALIELEEKGTPKGKLIIIPEA